MTSAPALAWSRHFQAQADPNNVPRVGPPDAITAPHERNVAMRTRAYRPEVSGCLEDRSLLSSVAGLSADPVVLTRREFNLIPEQIHEAFQSSFQNGGISRLRDGIREAVANIPFAGVDGLAVSINGILNRMQHDLSAKVPHAFSSARNDVIAVTRADVQARVQAGDIVVR